MKKSEYSVEQTLSGVCYSWPASNPKVFVRSMGQYWYWNIPGVEWKSGFKEPLEALEAGRETYLANGKEKNL